jgi:hypothetical protein
MLATLRWSALGAALAITACRAAVAGVVPDTSAASPSPPAESYLRPLDGVVYAAPDSQAEQQAGTQLRDLADSYVLRDAVVRGSKERLRLVVLHVAERYAARPILDPETGFGRRGEATERLTLHGVPAFYHSDVRPNFLVWQQGRVLAVVYGTDRGAMVTLAEGLIAANR